MSNHKSFSISTRIKSFGYAIEGVKTFFITQHNAWIHAIAAAMVIMAGLYFNISLNEWCFLVMAVALVFITEMLNTAIEFLTDRVSTEIHPLSKKVKDVAAASVLLSAIAALVIGGLIFIPKFFE